MIIFDQSQKNKLALEESTKLLFNSSEVVQLPQSNGSLENILKNSLLHRADFVLVYTSHMLW